MQKRKKKQWSVNRKREKIRGREIVKDGETEYQEATGVEEKEKHIEERRRKRSKNGMKREERKRNHETKKMKREK